MDNIKRGYRIVSVPSWQVQKLYDGQWRTVYYCKNEEAANRRLRLCLERQRAWNKRKDKIAAILRNQL